MIKVTINEYDLEVIANFDCGDVGSGIKLEKDKDTFVSAVVKTVEVINQLLAAAQEVKDEEAKSE